MILSVTDAWFILCTNKIYTYVLKKSYFIFPITKGSVNALMKLAGFSTSNKVKNHCLIYCYMSKDHSNNETKNPLPPTSCGLLFPISNKEYFI